MQGPDRDAERGAVEGDRNSQSIAPFEASPHSQRQNDNAPGSAHKANRAVAEIDTASDTLRRAFLSAPLPKQRPDSVIQEHRDRGFDFRQARCRTRP